MQIRTRLTLQFLLIVASIMLVGMVYTYFQFKSHLEDEFFDNLRLKAKLTAEMIINELEQPPVSGSPNRSNSENTASPAENISIYDVSNRRIFTYSPSSPEVLTEVLENVRWAGEHRFEHGIKCALGLRYVSHTGKTYVVIAEAPINDQALEDLSRILVFVFCVFVAVVALSGYVFAGQALAPVSRIMNQVDAISPSDLSRRLEIERVPRSRKGDSWSEMIFLRKIFSKISSKKSSLSDGLQTDELSRLAITFNRLLDRIQRAFNAQKMFLSNVSHELKNPLTVIISQLEIVLDKDRSKEEYQQTLHSVLDDVKELNDVSNKLMQLAKVNSDGAAIQFERLRIDELIWQVKATLLKAHPAYKISFEVVNLPEDEDKLFVRGNEQLLKTALLNLMENGCKFSPGKDVKVSLSFTTEGSTAIEIQDRGPGISKEELPMIFQPFYRSSKTSVIKGSGIGLSLVDSIVKLHRIEMKVASEQKMGTTFRLEFPLN